MSVREETMRHEFAACLVLMASAAGTFIAQPARAQGQAPPADQHDQQEKASEQAPDPQKRSRRGSSPS